MNDADILVEQLNYFFILFKLNLSRQKNIYSLGRLVTRDGDVCMLTIATNRGGLQENGCFACPSLGESIHGKPHVEGIGPFRGLGLQYRCVLL